jgi:hypothetical protein
MVKQRKSKDVLHTARSFQKACVLAAAADLDVFNSLHGNSISAQALVTKLNIDL